MKDVIKTASVSGMLAGLVLVAGCGSNEELYYVSGNITGLDGTLELTNNNSDSLHVVGNGNFTFKEQDNGSSYNVTVSQQPAGQICTITNASGSIAWSKDVTDVAVSCIDNGSPKPQSELEQKPLNDTGITLCGDYSFDGSTITQANLDCASTGAGTRVAGIDGDGDPVPAGQDAVYGRDVSHNNNSDGHAGFSFTKLDGNGQALAATATSWDCVQDNVTGLTWEVKTDDGGLQDNDWTYSWYNSSGGNTGGDHGIGDTGVGSTTGYEQWPYKVNYEDIAPGVVIPTSFTGSDNCLDNARCDTEKYVADVNAAGLCGVGSAWRLPTAAELFSLVRLGQISPAIDSDYFPNTVADSPRPASALFAARYWSASPVSPYRSRAVQVVFDAGFVTYGEKEYDHSVRLVRVSQ